MRNMRTKTGFMAVLAALLIAFAMMLTIQTDTIYAESDSVPYYCYSLEGTTAVQSNDSCANYAEVTDSNEPVNWRSGWYVVKGSDVHISKRITVSGEANLILCDGATLTAEKGITVAAGEEGTPGDTLNIYGQTEGTGKLVAMTADNINNEIYYSGIGSENGLKAAGEINIHGGVIEASGGWFGAGIGGGNNDNADGGDGGTVTIYDGKVTARGGNGSFGTQGAAGIGGGAGYSTGGAGHTTCGDGGTVTVYGGEVEAIGGSGGGAGIGGGYDGNGGIVTIYGGTVTANGGLYGGAGIGGGASNLGYGDGGNVKVYGGIVKAAGGYWIDNDEDVGDNYNGMGIGIGNEGDDSGTLIVGSGMFVYGDAHDNCNGDVENVHTLIEPNGNDFNRQTYMVIEPAVRMTFKVKNGLWNNGDRDDKTVYLATRGSQNTALTAEDIPAAGEKPDKNYQAGSWDPVPSPGDKQEATYTYTYAGDPKPSLQQVKNGVVSDIKGGQENCVYFGNYPQSSDGNGGFNVDPIKWRVLANADKRLFLLSDQNLEWRNYGGNLNETWGTSVVRAWLNGNKYLDSTLSDYFNEAAFSADEYAAVAETSNETKQSIGPNELTTEKVFLLSKEEAMNPAYGFTDDNNASDSRMAQNTDYVTTQMNANNFNNFWWLRSTNVLHEDSAYFVVSNGAILGNSKSTCFGIRPAFNLNLESVLFTSAAEGGKSSGAEGALNEVGTNTTGEWKLTLLDDGTITGLDGHKDFALSRVAGVKNGVSVKYTGAQPGNNEYISAIITDKPITEDGSAIKCYGRIAEASAADGTVTINTAGKLGENDHLYVFNEQYNDDKKTDYASALQEVPIPKLISYTVTFKVKNGSWNDGTKADQKVTLSRYDNEDKALVLQPGDIPKVGNRPASGYKAGSWDVTPKTDTQVSKDMTYTYTYAKADNPSPPKPQPKPIIDKAAAKIALDAGVVARSSGSKVTAGWGAVKGASSYVFYANYCDKKTLKKIKTVSGKTTSFDITKLNGKKFNPKKNLKFYVVAYKTVKGKKVKLAKSIMAHAPGSKNTKRTNVTGVKVKKASFTLKKGKTAKIKAKLILQKKGKKPLKHCAKFRYASSNKKVAKVSKKGKITAVGKGKCNVYVYAVSGVSKKIKVTVK